MKALHAGVCAGSVELPEGLWMVYEDYKAEAKRIDGKVREAESLLRIELGDAEVGTVGGEPVVKRTRYSVAGKTIVRKPYEVDKLTRLGARNGDSDE